MDRWVLAILLIRCAKVSGEGLIMAPTSNAFKTCLYIKSSPKIFFAEKKWIGNKIKKEK